MKSLNFYPFTEAPSLRGRVSSVPTFGQAVDFIQERLERALGTADDGRLRTDAVYALARFDELAGVKHALRDCGDTRNAREVALAIVCSTPRLVGSVASFLARAY